MTDFNRSNIESPVAKAWATYNTMTRRRKGVAPARKDAIAMAVKAGVSPGTAAVQFHKWLKEATSVAA